MKRLICLAGIPGAGKSTFAQGFGLAVVSSDGVRRELYGDQERYYSEETAARLLQERGIPADGMDAAQLRALKEKLCLDYVFEQARGRVRAALAAGESVVYGSTNLMARFRGDVLREACVPHVLRELYYLNTPLETALARNENRCCRIDPAVIRELFELQEPPAYAEGFDRIYEVDESGRARLLEAGEVIRPRRAGKETP